MENIKRVFPKIEAEDEDRLMEGLTAIWMEEDIPYFSEADMTVLIQRLYENHFDVYGIECFSRNDFGYFKTYVQTLYMRDHECSEENWYLEAFEKLSADYVRLVSVNEPDNPPVYNLTFHYFETDDMK